MVKRSDLDFTRMFFDIYGKKDLSKVPSLQSLEYIWNLGDEKLIYYFILCYDHKSPYVTTYRTPNIYKSKVYNDLSIGFTDEEQHSLFTIDSELYQQVVFELLRAQNEKIWTMICVHENLFDEYTEKLIKPIDADLGKHKLSDKEVLQAIDTKDKIRHSLGEIEKDLEALYHRFYGDDDKIKQRTGRITRVTPESYGNV